MQFRHILAPTDFSDYSKKAVVSALDLARTFGAKLTILHVVEFSPYLVVGDAPPGAPAVYASLPAVLEDLERRATEHLAQSFPEAESSGLDVVRLVAEGSPHRTITDTAEAEQADLIVIATAGRTGFSRLVMGSVAERVVRTAPCPVLTIRPAE